jgi:hypothetical protein
MKRSLVVLAALLPLGFAACNRGPGVVVQAAIEQEGAAEPVVLGELPVRLLPYDRDAIFDSLTAAFAEPEPEIPPEILQQQAAVQTAQTEWRDAEERWGTVRDSLRTLANDLRQREQQGQRATPQYQQAFREFQRLEAEERQVKQRMDAAFTRFDQMQRNVLTRADSIRAVREAWADRAFADFDKAVEARLKATGREEHVDTTNASGIARLRVPNGRWWVYARYTLPYQELYWNVPIEVTGDSTTVRLSRETAQERPVM